MKTIRRDDFLIGPKDKAIQAVKEGKTEDAIKYIEELSVEFQPTHDRFAEFIQSLLAFVSDNLGEEAVEDALMSVYENVYKKKLLDAKGGWKPKKITAEQLVSFWARANRNHWSDFYVEEDDEKFTMVITQCGSGGKLHAMDAPGKTSKSYPWSFNEKNVTYFCDHEPVFEAGAEAAGLSTEDHRYELLKDANGKEIGLVCKWIAYKNKEY